ncbi:unnamed protein product, partial [Rangifer tarandus platyrhynchus]
PPPAAPLSPARRTRRCPGALESRSQVFPLPGAQGSSRWGPQGAPRKAQSLGDRRWRPSWCAGKSGGEKSPERRVRGPAAAAARGAASCPLPSG